MCQHCATKMMLHNRRVGTEAKLGNSLRPHTGVLSKHEKIDENSDSTFSTRKFSQNSSSTSTVIDAGNLMPSEWWMWWTFLAMHDPTEPKSSI